MLVRDLHHFGRVAALATGMLLAGAALADESPKIGTFVLASEADYLATPPALRAFVFRHMDEVENNPTRQVRHGDHLRELPVGAPVDVKVAIQGRQESIDSFMDRYGIASLVVVKDGVIRAERYQYGNKPSSRMVVQSVTKSITSTALAVALKEGKIGSLDEMVTKYVPELAGTAYGSVTIRDVADMVPGVQPSEASAEQARDLRRKAYYSPNRNAVLDLLATYKTYAKPGEAYAYADINYYVISLLLTRAVGKPLSEYVSEKIWKPAGMEYDAYMRLTHAGQEDGHGGMAMTALDMARFGLFVLDTFQGKGGPNVPSGWFAGIAQARPDRHGVRVPGRIAAVPGFGYELGWWTLPRGGSSYQLGDDGGFAALGFYGQAIYVVPGQNVVAILQSASTVHAPELFARGRELVTAIVQTLKQN
ncbi:MAG TPA: serine hydrolase [Ramlibacter sp.]|nr:serine hydrolase [Ramlibacter sp.]